MRLKRISVRILPPPPRKSSPKKNSISICFTGFDQSDKSRLSALAKENGIDVKSDVGKSLFFLCVGKNKGWRKVQKASDYGVIILTEEQFINFIDTGEIPLEQDCVVENDISKSLEKDVNTYKSMIDEFSLSIRTVREFRRSNALIAVFVDGYAAGWRFAVKECYKDSLDIKLTPVKTEFFNYEIWTQGDSFQFNRGDVFYSDRLAYDSYCDFLKLDDAVVLQVKYECFSGYDSVSTFDGVMDGEFSFSRMEPRPVHKLPVLIETQLYDPGKIIVDVFVPDAAKKQLKLKDTLELKQDEFVCLLQSGCCWVKRREAGDKKKPEFINLFKK
ncbi:BRCT domain-containing protein [Escherichia coli]|uniref:BRCT domain-containing protein n=1 Tax=Escherichia coli TaxID=562 RepID=UPI000BDF3235|nr:BRCT domain-containing protein [Escherichia coli]